MFHLLQGLSLLLCQTDRINYKFSGGDWVTGQAKPFSKLLLVHC